MVFSPCGFAAPLADAGAFQGPGALCATVTGVP